MDFLLQFNFFLRSLTDAKYFQNKKQSQKTKQKKF